MCIQFTKMHRLLGVGLIYLLTEVSNEKALLSSGGECGGTNTNCYRGDCCFLLAVHLIQLPLLLGSAHLLPTVIRYPAYKPHVILFSKHPLLTLY